MNFKISIIIPAYNEANRMPIEEVKNFALANKQIAIVLVNDGSTDNTDQIVKDNITNIANIYLLTLPKNIGKGNAVREGMQYAFAQIPCEYYAYFDADLSTPLTEVFLLLTEIEKKPTLEMVFGSRILKIGSVIKRKTYRHYIGRVIATLISNQLGLSIYDTQCGAKLFTAQSAKRLFNDTFISRWLFDVELFNRMLMQYNKQTIENKIKEIPLNTWIDVQGSKLGWIDLFKTPIDLLKIAIFYKNKKEK